MIFIKGIKFRHHLYLFLEILFKRDLFISCFGADGFPLMRMAAKTPAILRV